MLIPLVGRAQVSWSGPAGIYHPSQARQAYIPGQLGSAGIYLSLVSQGWPGIYKSVGLGKFTPLVRLGRHIFLVGRPGIYPYSVRLARHISVSWARQVYIPSQARQAYIFSRLARHIFLVSQAGQAYISQSGLAGIYSVVAQDHQTKYYDKHKNYIGTYI